MGLHSYTLYSTIKRNARILPDRIALISGEEKVSYSQLLGEVDRLACGLAGRGIGKGDRIAILAQNCLEFVYLYGAAAKIGAIMVPLNWRLKTDEIEFILTDCEPKAIFVGQEFEDLVSPLFPKGTMACYTMGHPFREFLPFNELTTNQGKYREEDVSEDDEHVIIYTAAVHGKPRGATITHGNLLYFSLQSMYYWRLTQDDVHILLMPLFHNFGMTFMFFIMQAGGLNIIISKFDVGMALNCIQEYGVTIFGAFPPMLDSLLNAAKERKCDLSSLRVVMGIDRPETVKEFEAMSRATYWTGYAQTETVGFVSLAPYLKRPGSAGAAGYVTEIEIMNESGDILDPGNSGEIVTRGPMIFKGYWNLEEDNKHTFRDGWHHTGDIGRLDGDGYLWYLGRTPEKDLIKTGGENVYPAEVEKVILEHPMVREVSVIGVPDEQWGEAIKAVCVIENGKNLTQNELIEFVGARIARFKRPKYVSFVSAIPKTEHGSVDRKKVKLFYGSLGG